MTKSRVTLTKFFGAAILATFTDNAALTDPSIPVKRLSDRFKYGLIASSNHHCKCTNLAGITILRGQFEDKAMHQMLLQDAPSPIIAALAFRLLQGKT